MTRIVYYNRTRETTSGTPGVSTTVTVNGAVSGHRTFSSHSDLAVGDTFYYLMEDLDDLDWEIGLGTWVGSNQFTRQSTCLDNSSGSTALINFGSNTEVALIWGAEAIDDLRINEINKSILTSTDIVDVALYDTRNDNPSGAWRAKIRWTSWYIANGDFPKLSSLVAQGGTTDTVSVYDITNVSTTLYKSWTLTNPSSVRALQGMILVGTSAGTVVIDLIKDQVFLYSTSGKSHANQNVENFNMSTVTWTVVDSTAALVDNTVNTIEGVVLSGAGADSLRYNLLYPMITNATDAGLSVINHDGSSGNEDDVVDLVDVAGDDANGVMVNEDGDVFMINETQGDLNIWRFGNYTADSTTPDVTYDAATTPALLENPANNDGLIDLGSDVFVIGGTTGISIVAEDTATQASGMAAHITKDYSSGWMPGDIRGAWLANSKTADRSVKANTLTETGTVTEGAVVTGADLLGYSGWSPSNYLERAYDADFDFGTNGFCVIGWFKSSATSVVEVMLQRSNAGAGARFSVEIIAATSLLQFFISDGTTPNNITSINAVDDGLWHMCVAVNDQVNNQTLLYLDGKLESTGPTANIGNMNNGSAFLTLGTNNAHTNAFTSGTMTLWRISQYVPTAAQIAKIYNDERRLFQGNALALLQGTTNVVQDLRKDSSNEHWYAATTDGTTIFNGLQPLEYVDNSASHITSDDHLAVSAVSDYYTIGTAAEAIVKIPQRSLVEDT